MIDDPQLLQFLQREEARATDTTLNEERKTALEFYRGDLFGDEVDGRSKLRTRDVAEVVDYMLASILRTLVSGDKVVEFEPSTPGQDDIAQQITDRIHWNFLREQDGYAILRDGVKAGLLEKSGVWKSWVERPKVPQPVRLNARDLEAAGPDITQAVPASELYDVLPMVDEAGQPVLNAFGEPEVEPVQVYDAIQMVPGQARFRDAAIPNEEFFVAPDARTLDSAIYIGNISRVALSDLIAMGYAEADVANLWGDDGSAQSLRDARDDGRANSESDTVRLDLARQVTLREEYVRYAWNGSYQLLRVHRVHNSILSVEPVAMQPYTLWCPFPMPHRLIGQSLADKTMDIQVSRSHMLRQAMDALYIANAPRLYVDMSQCDETTLDDVLDVAPGGIVRGNGPNAVQPLTQPFAANYAFEAMQIMAGEKESRTGITRLNQGVDADALNKTATGTALMQASGQQMEEMVAREVANAIGEMFEKKFQLMTSEMEPHRWQFDGKVVEIDPSQWPTDLRMAVRVGLGSGNKDKKLQAIALLKQTQGEAFELDPRMVTPEQAFETAKLVTSVLGLGPATQFFADPGDFQQQPEQPDPAVLEAQAKIAQQQAEFQARQQNEATKIEMQRQEMAARMDLDRQKAEAEMQLARERMAAEFQLKRDEMMFSGAMNANMAADRPGGSLAQ